MDLHRVPDGGALGLLHDGLTIIRRRKHEPLAGMSRMSPAEIVLRTGKVQGSKFSADWSLERLTGWIEQEVGRAEWRLEPGRRRSRDVRFSHAVDVVTGRKTHTIRLVSDGRSVHAYPVRDKP